MTKARRITRTRVNTLKKLGKPFCSHDVMDIFNITEKQAKGFLMNTQSRHKSIVKTYDKGICPFQKYLKHTFYNVSGHEDMIAKRDTKTIAELNGIIERQQAQIIDMQDKASDKQREQQIKTVDNAIENAEDRRVEVLKNMLIGLIKGI